MLSIMASKVLKGPSVGVGARQGRVNAHHAPHWTLMEKLNNDKHPSSTRQQAPAPAQVAWSELTWERQLRKGTTERELGKGSWERNFGGCLLFHASLGFNKLESGFKAANSAL